MTSAEWAEAFRTGDPEKIGRTIHRAIQHAGTELGTQPEPDWDALTPVCQAQLVRTGQLLREWGCLVLAGPEVTGDCPSGCTAHRTCREQEVTE